MALQYHGILGNEFHLKWVKIKLKSVRSGERRLASDSSRVNAHDSIGIQAVFSVPPATVRLDRYRRYIDSAAVVAGRRSSGVIEPISKQSSLIVIAQ